MELVSVYLYTRASLETKGISNATFHSLKRNGWYKDARSNRKFMLLNKRIQVGKQMYRALIRFQYDGIVNNQETFILSLPTPFILTTCEPVESGMEIRWKDTRVFHVSKIGIPTLLQEGIPSDIIDEINQDLEQHITYIEREN